MLALMIRGGPRRMIRQANGQPARLVLIALPAAAAQPAAQFLGSVDRRLIAARGFVAALALAATWWLTRRLTQPLSELREAARDLALGQLSRRVATGGTDEVADLARGFNAMAAELERQRQLRRDLVHDVAHELRAPLTALRCRVEAAIDGVSPDPGRSLRELNEDVQHLSQLVSDLEDLAHAEAREIRLALAEVRLDDVCQSALRAAKLDADPRVRTAFAPDLTAHGDVVRIRQIVVNLLTNANRHTPHDGRITLRTVSRDGMAAIDVHNTGSALSPDELRRVFDRFYRADPSRQRATGGSGLGLAIVKHLAEAQGGRVWAASDEDGVTFGVALPPGRR
jgi:signal transduction histidine kinase